MKIVQITPYYPPHVGGVENCVKAISEGLASKGYSVLILTSNIGVKKNINENLKNLKVLRLNSVEFAHTSIILTLVFRLLILSKDTIIHVHIAQAFIPEVVCVVSRIRKIPYVAHFHIDVDASGKLGFLLATYKKLILKHVLKNAKKIICLSNIQKKFLIDKYNLMDKDIVVIPNGISEKFIKQTHIINKTAKKLLYVGRLSSQKNIEMLLSATKYIKSEYNFYIIGEGELKNKLLELIKKNNLKNIIFEGKKSQDELISYYQNCDILISISTKEGMSLVLLEALASGIPIIASNIPENKQFLLSSAVYVSTDNPRQIGEKINELMKNTKIRKRLSVSQQKLVKQYRWDTIIAKIEKCYII